MNRKFLISVFAAIFLFVSTSQGYYCAKLFTPIQRKVQTPGQYALSYLNNFKRINNLSKFYESFLFRDNKTGRKFLLVFEKEEPVNEITRDRFLEEVFDFFADIRVANDPHASPLVQEVLRRMGASVDLLKEQNPKAQQKLENEISEERNIVKQERRFINALTYSFYIPALGFTAMTYAGGMEALSVISLVGLYMAYKAQKYFAQGINSELQEKSKDPMKYMAGQGLRLDSDVEFGTAIMASINNYLESKQSVRDTLFVIPHRYRDEIMQILSTSEKFSMVDRETLEKAYELLLNR